MGICTENISQILKALSFAAEKHRNQRRKDRQASPYINHCIDVADILWEIGEIRDIPSIVAAILHDTLEDTDTTPEELEREFGSEIRSIVEEVTDDKNQPAKIRKQNQIDHAPALSRKAGLIKYADKISNIRDIVDSPPVNWSAKRKLDYVTWGENVINNVRTRNKALEYYFNELIERTRKSIGNKDKGK